MHFLLMISRISTLCLPGSSECDGDTIKICDLNGEWVTIDCPSNSKCALNNNKITCLPNKEIEIKPVEPLPSKDIPVQNEADKTNNDAKQKQNNIDNESADQNKMIYEPNAKEKHASEQENKSQQEGDTSMSASEQPPSPQQPEAPVEKPQDEPKSTEESKTQPEQPTTEVPKEQTVAPEEKTEKTITVYKTVTEKVVIETQKEPEIFQEVVKTVKRPEIPCCSENIQESCRICNDVKPIRAIIIDRESLLGKESGNETGQNATEMAGNMANNAQSAEQPGAQEGGGAGATEDQANSEGAGGNTGDTQQEEAQQSSGPAPALKSPSNSAKSSGNKKSSNLISGGGAVSAAVKAKKNTIQEKLKAQAKKIIPKKGDGIKLPSIKEKLESKEKLIKPPRIGDEAKVESNLQQKSLESKKEPLKSLKTEGQVKTEDKLTTKTKEGTKLASASSESVASITKEQIQKIAGSFGHKPPDQNVSAVAEYVKKSFKSLNEAAMFIAQIIHESGGLVHLSEQGCKENKAKCGANYDDGKGVPGKYYYGRGFIQLSWAANYKAASQGLGMGDKLLNNPDLVSDDPKIAIQTAIWYWQTRVATAPGVKENKFGATTKAINGALECQGSNVDKSKKRYAIYKKAVEILNIKNPASESGCYN